MPTSGPDRRRRHEEGVGTMRNVVVGGLMLGCVLIACVMTAGAAQVDDAARFEQGEQLYEARCARCHGATGEGSPPTFPALSGNGPARGRGPDRRRPARRLGEHAAVPHSDRGRDLLAGQLRPQRVDERLRRVTTDEVAALADPSADAGPMASVWGRRLHHGPGRRAAGWPTPAGAASATAAA